ncbi:MULTISPECIES: hypothetical protein [Burkholderiaceae]|nr:MULTISPECIES: hypothetical protein [Burkholderiaceae]MCG1038781.1 hypothetical protein [Mycetohabitans sp. B7]
MVLRVSYRGISFCARNSLVVVADDVEGHASSKVLGDLAAWLVIFFRQVP